MRKITIVVKRAAAVANSTKGYGPFCAKALAKFLVKLLTLQYLIHEGIPLEFGVRLGSPLLFDIMFN